MLLKLMIAAFAVMLMVMPYTHHKAYKSGRVSMYQEILDKEAFIDGEGIDVFVPNKASGTCGNCHARGNV